MTMVPQLVAIFVFGLAITGVVFLGLVRAREVQERIERTRMAEKKDNPAS
jgi:hypothetical protein